MSRIHSIREDFAGAIPASRITAALVAGVIGLFMLAGVGFAQVSHDVAHDARHSAAFPCH